MQTKLTLCACSIWYVAESQTNIFPGRHCEILFLSICEYSVNTSIISAKVNIVYVNVIICMLIFKLFTAKFLIKVMC